MKKRFDLGLICSLVCAAGSLVLTVAELFNTEVSGPRRTFRVFLCLASCAVWTASLVVGLGANQKEAAPETVDLTQIKEDNFHE